MSVNLAVPFFSQRENSYIWKQRYEDNKKDKRGKIIHKKGWLEWFACYLIPAGILGILFL